jgi:ferredoxin
VHVTIDLTRCVMAGECVYNHPALFAFADDGDHAVALVAEPSTPEQELGARQAAAVCPSGAITIDG